MDPTQKKIMSGKKSNLTGLLQTSPPPTPPPPTTTPTFLRPDGFAAGKKQVRRLLSFHPGEGGCTDFAHSSGNTVYPTTLPPIWKARKWRKVGAGTQNLRHRDISGGAGVAQGGAGVAQGGAGQRKTHLILN